MNKIKTWDEAFAPVLALGREVREGQRQLGQAVLDVVNNGGNLLGEAQTGTGKSYATLVPIIVAIQDAKRNKKDYRGIVSTETLALQDQIFRKDLPFLSTLYKDFTFRKLMGRSNYLCFESADSEKVGDKSLDALVELLKARKDNLGDGEKSDVERVIGRELENDEWESLQGSSTFCGDNQCTPEVCFGALARKHAKEADIVVVNHAVLATDLEIRMGATAESSAEDGLLGSFEALVVDEGHQLVSVLEEQWTKELSMWELSNMSSSVAAGIEHGQQALANASIGRLTQEALDDIVDAVKSVQNFLTLLSDRDGQKWAGSSHAVCEKYLTGVPPSYLMNAMTDYEEETPRRLAMAEATLAKSADYLMKASLAAAEIKLRKKSKITKALRAAKELMQIVRILKDALETKDGIVNAYGIYGVTVKGWEKRDGTQGMTIRMKPLDVSTKAQYMFHNKTNILVSATLTDLTDGTFKYVKASTGFPQGAKEVRVSTPFSLETQQLFYMTPANSQRVDHLRGAQFSFAELIAVVKATRGRSLVLFTSREELDYAAEAAKQLQAQGKFPYPILVQERDSDKNKLMEEFKSVTESVLFATKSFFVGIDVPGEALSGVWLCKWPNPMYNAECKQQVTYWKKRGFSRWYERESLTTFQQAAGRLVRSSGCKGVVGILDFRVSDVKQSVYKSALIGVKAIGSPVTIDIRDVEKFFAPA